MQPGESLAGVVGLGIDEPRLRLLGLAVLASLVLHALILLCLSIYREAMPARIAPPPLTAHLAKPKPPPEPLRFEPLPAPVARPAAPRQPRPAPALPRAPILSMEPQKQAAEPAFVVPPAPPQPPAPAQSPVPADVQAAPGASGPDPASVARFRLLLLETAKRHERYPRIALDNNWEGQVGLRLLVAENGALASVTVIRSAGRAVLDEEGRSMVRSAYPEVPLPAVLRGKTFLLEVFINFKVIREER